MLADYYAKKMIAVYVDTVLLTMDARTQRIQSKKHVVDRGVKQLRGFRDQSTIHIPYDMKTGTLNVTDLGLTRLPSLPINLRKLFCDGNRLKTLPVLPQTLNVLSCSNNLLQSLPALPNTLTRLDCSYNCIKEMPELPASLNVLHCSNNELKCLPALTNLIQLEGERGNPWNPRFLEMMKSKNMITTAEPFAVQLADGSIAQYYMYIHDKGEKSIQLINEFHENIRATKAIARNVLNVPNLKDKLPDDLLNIVGSFLSGNTTTLFKQLDNLHERVIDSNDCLSADKRVVPRRSTFHSCVLGWRLKWHKEKQEKLLNRT